MIIVPPQTRTFFFQYTNYDDGQEYIQKYKLNFPEIQFDKDKENFTVIKVFDDKGIECIPPFTNIDGLHSVCFGNALASGIDSSWIDLEKSVDLFFRTAFTTSYADHLAEYINFLQSHFENDEYRIVQAKIHDFYQTWEKQGIFLIPKDNVSIPL